jgi:cell shape-determining protein MreC
MLRLALILAAVASIGVAGFTFFEATPKVQTLVTTLKDTNDKLTKSEGERTKAVAEAKAAKTEMEKKARELSETKQDLEKSQTEEATQRARADKASTELAKTQKERNESREELARWLALGVKPEEINGLKADLKKAKEDIEVAEVDKKSLNHRIDGLESRLHRYEGDTAPPIEMPGLRGKVVAVDRKWNFIVIDVGSDKAKEQGVIMISRGDKLVGKARIVRVEEKRSIANLLPEWSQDLSLIAEGNSVVY